MDGVDFVLVLVSVLLALVPFVCIFLIMAGLITIWMTMRSIARDSDRGEPTPPWRDYDAERRRRRRGWMS